MKLYQYQIKYLQELKPRAIMAASTGTGKTVMALAHYAQHALAPTITINPNIKGYKWTPPQPLLILAPASKVRTGDWQREITEYFGEGNEPQYEIYSYEKFSRNPTLTQFRDGKRAIWQRFSPLHGGEQWAVIADECHRLKSPSTGIGKAMYFATRNASFFVGLSATPLPNGWIDFANYSKIWGYTKGITEFKQRYCNIQTYKGFPEIIGYWREDELREQWNAISKRLTKDQAHDLPPRTFVGVNFKRPPEYMRTFLERKTSGGEMLDTAPKLAHALRQTLTAGKLDYLSDLIDGTDENIVIFYNYISEREAILALLAKKHSDRRVYRQDGEKHEIPTKADWPNVKRSVTLAHYKSGGTGVEMTYATICVYFSPTYSYAEYVQSLGRTYRIGQQHKVTVYNFRTRSTIEVDVYDALKSKTDFQERVWATKQLQTA